MSGTVAEVNSTLLDEPELANQDPYGKGWIIKVGFSSSVQSKNLLSADEYSDIVG